MYFYNSIAITLCADGSILCFKHKGILFKRRETKNQPKWDIPNCKLLPFLEEFVENQKQNVEIFLIIDEIICLSRGIGSKLRCFVINRTGAMSTKKITAQLKAKIQTELTVFNKTNMAAMGTLCVSKLGLLFFLRKYIPSEACEQNRGLTNDNKRCNFF